MMTAAVNVNSESSIVVVAKCPIRGKSKTRLIPLLGEEGAAQMSKAMLSDVLSSISKSEAIVQVRKILFYAPGNEDGCRRMTEILEELDLLEKWILIPMLSTGDMRSSDLGAQLIHALQQVRSLSSGNVLYLGMDCPELPLEEIAEALSRKDMATLCPAEDGGYGMLCIPPQTPESIFKSVRWSDPLTALSQLKTLTDAGITVKLGRLMNDIDEPDDLRAMAQRLVKEEETLSDDALLRSSATTLTRSTPSCPFTLEALGKLSVLPEQPL